MAGVHTFRLHAAGAPDTSVQATYSAAIPAASRHPWPTQSMSTEHPPEGTGLPARRVLWVDLDPSGIVTGKIADRQRRQFLNYSLIPLDPVFRRLPADDQRSAAAEFIELVLRWESRTT